VTVLNDMKECSEAGGVGVMVTHDDRALEYATRKIALFDGLIKE
jgi:ABC-type lipoprotein export system ATPase subunit